jgi:hypothetical protein
VHYEAAVVAAERMFRAICPGAEFLPEQARDDDGGGGSGGGGGGVGGSAFDDGSDWDGVDVGGEPTAGGGPVNGTS